MVDIRVIVTAPPYAPFLGDVARHPVVVGLRLNSVMPVKGGPTEALDRLSQWGLPVWVDLKGRQLRVAEAAVPPYTSIRLSHRISVDTPVDAFFSDGRELARVAAVDGDRLILSDGPKRLVGPGESVNIVHPSLQVGGFLTSEDRGYLKAMSKLGHHRVMLSYVESAKDVEEVLGICPGADVMLKIENERGLEFVCREGSRYGRLVAARGDLFVEVLRPHRIINAVRAVIRHDSDAFVASRLFESLIASPVPSSADIGDAAFLFELGYRRFVLGDAVCFDKRAVISALNLLQAIAGEFPEKAGDDGGRA